MRKFLLGGEPKKSHMNKLLGLPEICLPVQELDDYLQKISTNSSVVVDDKYAEGIEKISSVLERVGIGLAPLDEDMAEIAHRAIAGHIYRMETCLAMLAKLNGNMMSARLHLSRALHHATLIDDVKSEMLATDQLGLLALARNKWSRAAELFEIAERQAQAIKASRLRYVVCAGMARYLSGEKELATKHLTSAQGLVQENLGRAGNELLVLGEGLMAMDEVGLAIEVLDEGMECAIEAKETELTERLAEYLVLANNALTDSDAEQYLGLRQYLDDINTVAQTSAEEFDERISDIEQQAEIMSQPIEAPDGWVDAETVFPTSTKFTVLRQILTSDKEVLIIGQHSDLGIIGFWLPDSEHNVSAGQNITIAQTQVKVADAPSELRSEHNLSSLVAIKDCSKISFSAEINM